MLLTFDDIIKEIVEKSQVTIFTISPSKKPLPSNYEGPTGIKNSKRIVQLAKKWPEVIDPQEVFEYHKLIQQYFRFENFDELGDTPTFYEKTRERILEFLNKS